LTADVARLECLVIVIMYNKMCVKQDKVYFIGCKARIRMELL
jgi:hypothetical protein